MMSMTYGMEIQQTKGGRWENDTLVVDTVAIREDALFDTFSSHSDQFTVRECIRFMSPGVLEDQITDLDPKALVEPFHSVRTYRKAAPPNDELREFSCAEGPGSTKRGVAARQLEDDDRVLPQAGRIGDCFDRASHRGPGQQPAYLDPGHITRRRQSHHPSRSTVTFGSAWTLRSRP